MELVPLVLSRIICLFYLGNVDLAFSARTVSFSRIDIFRGHIDELHLSHHDPSVPLVCPHPSCDISLQSVNHFKMHAATVHTVFLSKQLMGRVLVWEQGAVTCGTIDIPPDAGHLERMVVD